MSEIGDAFQGMREHAKVKREQNKAFSTALLVEHGVPFTSHNDGVHLVVQSSRSHIDFWPSTGLWTVRNPLKSRRGVRLLLEHLKQIGDIK